MAVKSGEVYQKWGISYKRKKLARRALSGNSLEATSEWLSIIKMVNANDEKVHDVSCVEMVDLSRGRCS